MEHWDLHTLEVETRQPRILHSARGEARSILIALAAGEGLQDHQVHERAYVVVIAGEVDLAGAIGGPGLAAVFEPAAPRRAGTERRAIAARTGALARGRPPRRPRRLATFSSEASAPPTTVPAWVAP